MNGNGNRLYYGDNLTVLREHVEDESVDLVYLDPPFKSNQDYNVLFREQDGTRAAAQIQAFEDTWQWDSVAAAAFQEIVISGGRISQAMQALHTLLGNSDMLAYLSMMAPRLMELRRVLKPTGAIYLHCDPTASHYLKLLLDAVFGPQHFRNEIIWKRTSAHSSAKRYGPVHDSLLFYTSTDSYIWNPQFEPYDEEYIETFFEQKDSKGRRWKRMDLTGAGVRHGETGQVWRGIDVTAKGRHWAYPPKELDEMDAAGKIHWPKKASGMPRLKQYEDEMPGVPLQDIWTDIRPLHNLAAERLGYPTQKPEALLERIIHASSNEGETVLDPFCGCGTSIAASQRLRRHWIGIDITHLAISLIRHRLRDAFGEKVAKAYKVVGEPTDLSGARELAEQDRFQFQCWALGLVGARSANTEIKRGADKGIDGRLYFHDEGDPGKTKQIIFSVKSGHLRPDDVRALAGVVDRDKAAMGVLLAMEEPSRHMRSDAAGAGFYVSPWGNRKFAKIQILTIEELLAGQRIDMPPHRDTVTFPKAPKARPAKPKQGEMFGSGGPAS